jgi:hypothetical protein
MTINPNLKTTGTILTMFDVGGKSVIPFYSARGLTQTLTPIGAAKSQKRTVNFELVNLALSRSQKYASVISAKDVRPPSRDDIWPGRIVTVACAYLASYPTIGGSPARTPLSGSQHDDGHGFTFYQPLITFMIGTPDGSFDEWNAGYSWSIPMEEV